MWVRPTRQISRPTLEIAIWVPAFGGMSGY